MNHRHDRFSIDYRPQRPPGIPQLSATKRWLVLWISCSILFQTITGALAVDTPNFPKIEPTNATSTYLSEKALTNVARETASAIEKAKIVPSEYEIDTYGSAVKKPELGDYTELSILERSPCNDNVEAMKAHRGWAWMVAAYSIFAVKAEPEAGTKWGYINSYNITRPLSKILLQRVLGAPAISRIIAEGISNARLSIEQRAELSAFLKVLLSFKAHHERLDAKEQGDPSKWEQLAESAKPKTDVATWLVERLNQLSPGDSEMVQRCLLGYAEFSVIISPISKVHTQGIYSGGLATYSVSFWSRRKHEGTTQFAEAVLKFTLSRIEP